MSTSVYEEINNLEAQIRKQKELLELIRKDLRMRSVNGVVDISGFVWDRLEDILNDRDKG